MNPDSVSAQVPNIADGVNESTKASTTEIKTITKRKKTNAQKCREYRERKKLQNTMVQNVTPEGSDKYSETDQLQAKKPKTNAERRKKYYEAQKLKKQKIKKIPLTNAERSKKYYEKQKLKKQQSKTIPKTVKQKNKEYYERKKIKQSLKTLNHHSDAFPKEPKIKEEKLIDATGRGSNWFPFRNSTICSAHFKEDVFQPLNNSRRVFEWAVPVTNVCQVITADTDTACSMLYHVPDATAMNSEIKTENAETTNNRLDNEDDSHLKKRQKLTIDDIEESSSSMPPDPEVDEECEILAKLWTRKLRKLPEVRRDHVIYQINNLLYRECVEYHTQSGSIPSPVHVFKEECISNCSEESKDMESKEDETSYIVNITKTEPEDE